MEESKILVSRIELSTLCRQLKLIAEDGKVGGSLVGITNRKA